jgi:AraC-like DNA-binding protein
VNSSKNKHTRTPSAAARQKAREIKFLLDSRPDKIPTLQALESEYHLSRIYLQSGFRELYGITIGSYVKTKKIKLIKEQLKDYRLTLDAIALNTGYNGGEALCRFFKNVEGVSPGQWRRDYLSSLP